MKTTVMFISVAVIAALAPAADANPLPASAERAAERAAPTSYLQVGAAAGADPRLLFAAVTVAVGANVPGTPLWVRATVGTGGAQEGLDHSDVRRGRYMMARAGAEARLPIGTSRRAAVVAGLDVGVGSIHYTDAMAGSDTSLVIAGAVGVDLGGRHLRFRPGFEVSSDVLTEIRGAALTAAVAWTW